MAQVLSVILRGHEFSLATFEPGDVVTIVLHPRKDGDVGGALVTVELPDGNVLAARGGRWSPERSSGDDAQ